MLVQYLRKRRKIFRGLYRTYVKRMDTPYDATSFWDATVFNRGVDDPKTISARKGRVATAYHYASVETLITRALSSVTLEGKTVLDLGSGAGHWLDFYARLGAHVVGIDISKNAVEHLRQRHANVHHGRIVDVLPALASPDLVNAIGVMFHLVEDTEWAEAIRHVARILPSDGRFVVGGHFGWLDGVNVQFDASGTVNKRLRSAVHWRRVLHDAGFSRVSILRNRAYLKFPEPLPESNVLVATR